VIAAIRTAVFSRLNMSLQPRMETRPIGAIR